MVTNCSGERSSSRLKRIKSDRRSAMSEEQLSGLNIPYIENCDLLVLMKSLTSWQQNSVEIGSNYSTKNGCKERVAFGGQIEEEILP
ncbi:Hypothetical predicted protein [Octopus vulgaris]|uniref:Uncharacterized protein n=1 Tax=Octopus vulgaris TaxID=6645 RepID=A0AA36FHE9_OCTVU|nr:Hypothetical predicted protein [Octopus vulgaris]